MPVLDVLDGRAVHAVGGDRSRYQPLRSILPGGCDPRKLARALRNELGLTTVYLADLDAIVGRKGDVSLYRDLLNLGLDLWLDPGLRDLHDLEALPRSDRLHVVAGLESLASPDALASMLDRVGPDRLILSLDLRHGRPILANPEAWESVDAPTIADRILAMGVRRLILLDLARVGSGSGTATTGLLATIHSTHPEVAVTVGGGVAGTADVVEAREQGAAAVLVGSTLHDGRIGRREIERLTI